MRRGAALAALCGLTAPAALATPSSEVPAAGAPLRVLWNSKGLEVSSSEVVAGTSGCVNDSTCIGRGGVAWQCVQARPGAAGSLPCHINGRQTKRPDGSWDWPGASCTCTDSVCHRAPTPAPSPAPGGLGYGCAAGRCMQLERGGTSNSSGTCEWATGCIAPRPNEWIAADFEWRRSNSTTITCTHAHTYLKKSQLQSGVLPSAEKLAVAVGTVVRLEAAPKPVAGTSYWLVSCAAGSLCATPPPPLATTALPQYLMIGVSAAAYTARSIQP